MFINCPNCHALVATDPATDIPPERCPRCAVGLRESPAAGATAAGVPAVARSEAVTAAPAPTTPVVSPAGRTPSVTNAPQGGDGTAGLAADPAVDEADPTPPVASVGLVPPGPGRRPSVLAGFVKRLPERFGLSRPRSGRRDTPGPAVADAPAPIPPAGPATGDAGRIDAERIEAKRIEAERIEAERIEAERIEAERIEAERIEAGRIEAQRIKAERIKAERIKAERIEAERIEAERIEAERIEAERIEAGRASVEGHDVEARPVVHRPPGEGLPVRGAKTTPSFVRTQAARSRKSRADWRALFAIAALSGVLLLQLLLADRARLAGDARWRPWMTGMCAALRCSLPPWREPGAFTLLERDVRPHPTRAGVLRVTASFRNDARWPQPWPRVLLTLSDLEGREAGTRSFSPAEYLGAKPTQAELERGQVGSLAMDVVEPAPRIVAFSFDFR